MFESGLTVGYRFAQMIKPMSFSSQRVEGANSIAEAVRMKAPLTQLLFSSYALEAPRSTAKQCEEEPQTTHSWDQLDQKTGQSSSEGF